MNLETTLKAIQKRADLMGATKGGAMAAILNAPEGSLEKALKEASSVGYVDVANYNSPAQVVITGDEVAVKKAGELLSEAGARRVVPLAVSGAFHSKFMEPAGKEFSSFVSELDMIMLKLRCLLTLMLKQQFWLLNSKIKCLNKFIHQFTGLKL